jgi:chromosome segregation ATPase
MSSLIEDEPKERGCGLPVLRCSVAEERGCGLEMPPKGPPELSDHLEDVSESQKRQALPPGAVTSWMLSALQSGDGDIFVAWNDDQRGSAELESGTVHTETDAVVVDRVDAREKEMEDLVASGQELVSFLSSTKTRLENRTQETFDSLQAHVTGLKNELDSSKKKLAECDIILASKDALIYGLRTELLKKQKEADEWRQQAEMCCNMNTLADMLLDSTADAAAQMQAARAHVDATLERNLKAFAHKDQIDPEPGAGRRVGSAAGLNIAMASDNGSASAYRQQMQQLQQEMATILSLHDQARGAAGELLQDIGVGTLVLDSAVSDMEAMFQREQDRERLIADMQIALLERQTSRAALQLQVDDLRAEVIARREKESTREANMSAVLSSLQQATSKIYVLEQTKAELKQENNRLRGQMDRVAITAKRDMNELEAQLLQLTQVPAC